MIDLEREKLYRDIDELSPDEFAKVRAFVLVTKHQKTHPGSGWFRAAYEALANTREAIAATGASEEEIDQAIDEAIDEVRRESNP